MYASDSKTAAEVIYVMAEIEIGEIDVSNAQC